MDLHTTLTALCAVEQGPLDGQLLRVTGLVPEVPSSQPLGAQCLLRRGLGQTAGTSGEAGEEGGAFGSESRLTELRNREANGCKENAIEPQGYFGQTSLIYPQVYPSFKLAPDLHFFT